MSCGIGRRHGLDLVLLWLRCRPAVAASIRPLAWELPYAACTALERQDKTKQNKTKILTPNSQQEDVFKLTVCGVFTATAPLCSHGVLLTPLSMYGKIVFIHGNPL